MGANFSSEPSVEKHTERAQNETFTAAVSTCQGWRMSQEDEHSLMLELPGDHKASFFAVFDGHGSGRVSKYASEELWRHITRNGSYIKGNFREALEESFLSFDEDVRDSFNALLAGTTAICVLIVDNVIYCANIGDSRAVASINCQCLPLSVDHKPENPLELKRILDAGGYVLGNRVNGNLALSRAFGDFHYKCNNDLPAERQIVCPIPDIKRIELNEDVDFILLACDGIWDVLSSEEVVSFVISRLERNIEPGLICEQLTTRCMATDYELIIGCDNMTVLLVCHTRGMSWEDYCTSIFEKNSKRLGVTRTRTFDDNFDNTFKENARSRDRYNDMMPQASDDALRVGGGRLHSGIPSSSSSDASSEALLDRTFATNETSTDSDNSSSENRGETYNYVMEHMNEIMESLEGFTGLGGSREGHPKSAKDENSDEPPLITEIVAEEEQNAASSSGASPSDETPPIIEVVAEEKEQTEASPSDETPPVTEVVAEREEESAEKTDAKPSDEDTSPPITEVAAEEGQSDDGTIPSTTLTIELAAPDDEAPFEDASATGEEEEPQTTTEEEPPQSSDPPATEDEPQSTDAPDTEGD